MFPKEVKLLGSGTPALASVHILSTNLGSCTSVYCCVILAVNLRISHYANLKFLQVQVDFEESY